MTASRNRRTALLLLGAAVSLAIIGGALVRIGVPAGDSTDGPRRDQTAVTAAARGDGASDGNVAGGPEEAGRDESGVVQAAVAYTAASQRWLYMTDDEVTQAVTGIATPESGDRLAHEVVEEVRTARDQLGLSPGRVWWLVHPLAWRVESFSRDEASVAVWTMTVLSAREVAVPQTAWMTVTVDLEWTGGAWRVDAVRDRPGPTPMTGPRDDPWESSPFDDALDGFTRLPGGPET